jgi:hypothetical protein
MNKPAVRFCPVAPFLMKYIIILIIFFISIEVMAKQIEDLNWKKRILIISYENKNNNLFIKIEKFISDYKCELNDRNLEIIFFEKFKNINFLTPKFINEKYGIWLLGYDGEIKDYSLDEKILFRLLNLIDSMPMRKNEIKNDKC